MLSCKYEELLDPLIPACKSGLPNSQVYLSGQIKGPTMEVRVGIPLPLPLLVVVLSLPFVLGRCMWFGK